jgi:hypothetical protein
MMAIVLKANKVNWFVSSVLFVLWYHSPNFLDTPRTMRHSQQNINNSVYCVVPFKHHASSCSVSEFQIFNKNHIAFRLLGNFLFLNALRVFPKMTDPYKIKRKFSFQVRKSPRFKLESFGFIPLCIDER